MKKLYSLLITALISIASVAQNTGDTLQKQPTHTHLPGKSDADGKFNLQIRQWILDHPIPGIYESGIEDLRRIGAPLEGMYFIGYNNPGKQNFHYFLSVLSKQKNKE